MKEMICTVAGFVGGAIAAALGGWDLLAKALLCFMGFDYLSGWLVAAVFHKSPKTATGAYASSVGLKGLIRKAMMFGVVGMGVLLDGVLGFEYLRNAIAAAFLVNEGLSIVENMGLMGIKMPKPVIAALDVLADKADAEPPDIQAAKSGADETEA